MYTPEGFSVKTPRGQRRYKKTDIEKLLGLFQEEIVSEPKVALRELAKREPQVKSVLEQYNLL